MSLKEIDNSAQQGGVTGYLQSLYHLVPTEITAAYLAIYCALNPMKVPGIDVADYVLFGSIIVLMVINFLFFKYIREETRTDVRLYMSITFLVWVTGVSVDYWTETILGNISTGYFIVLVILWAVGSVVFLHAKGLRAANG